MPLPYDLLWSQASLDLAGAGFGAVRERIQDEVEDIISETSGDRFATSAVTEHGAVFYCDASLDGRRWRVEVRRGRMGEGPRLPADAPPALRGKSILIPTPDESPRGWVADGDATRRLLA